MANYLTDTFTGSAADLTTHAPDSSNAGGNYTKVTGNTGTISLSGTGKATGTNNSTGAAYAAPSAPPSASYSVSADINLTGTAGTTILSVLGRIQSGAYTCYDARAEFLGGGTDRWSLYNFVAGVSTLLGSFNDTFTSGRTANLKLIMNGTTISVQVDGVTVISVTDSAISGAGAPGIGWFGTTANGWSFDNLSADQPAVIVGTITAAAEQNSAGVTATCSAASGGTAPYTYQWYRDANYRSGTGTAISGQTSLTLADPGPPAGGAAYWVRATDAASASANSARVPLVAGWKAPVCLLCIGTSWTQRVPSGGVAPPTTMQDHLSRYAGPRRVDVVNSGVGGSSTHQWQPGSGNLTAALSAGATAYSGMPSGTVKICHVDHGFNDAAYDDSGNVDNTGSGTTNGKFTTNAQAIIGALKATGWLVVWSKVAYCWYDGTISGSIRSASTLDAQNASRLGYGQVIDTLAAADPANVFVGAQHPFELLFAHPEWSTDDSGVHPNATGAAQVGRAWAAGVGAAIDAVTRRSAIVIGG